MTSKLVAARRRRVLDAMSEREVDALVLGRQDNVGYSTGMARLWTSGTRPFGAGCVLIAETQRTHLLSSWDAGISENSLLVTIIRKFIKSGNFSFTKYINMSTI